MSDRTRILIVTEVASSHSARWINQLLGSEFEPHVFQPGPPSGINPLLKCGVVHYPGQATPPPGVEVRPYRPESGSSETLACVPALADLLTQLDPALIHSHGLNINWRNLMTPVAAAIASLGDANRRPWLYSSWGTDLDFWPEMSSAHRVGVEQVLPQCHFMTNECLRDALLALRFGFQGRFLGLLPDYGGVDFEELERLGALPAPQGRRGIFLKGRDVGCPCGDPVGRAMTAMDAFALEADALADVPILIAQPSPNIRDRARELTQAGLQVRVLDHLPYDELLRLMASCSIFMALTSNDGLPSTLVEAMAMGLFPIHSDLEPIREWVRHGRNGMLVPYDDARSTAQALRWALRNDDAVCRAGRENEALMREHMSLASVRAAVVELYRAVCRTGNSPGGFPIEELLSMENALPGNEAFTAARKYWLASRA